jgi:hypothetical protein
MAPNLGWSKKKLLDIWFTRGEPHKESITKKQFVEAANAVIHWSSFTDAKNSMNSDSAVRVCDSSELNYPCLVLNRLT